MEDGPNLVTLAMNGWSSPEPAWWLNLQADPDASVELKAGSRLVRARAATGRSAIGCGTRSGSTRATGTSTRSRCAARVGRRSSSSSHAAISSEPGRDRRGASPDVPTDGDHGAPAQRDGSIPADRRAEQQPTHRLDHRRERLIRREPADRPWHGLGRDEPAAEEREEQERQRQVARGLDAVRIRPRGTASQVNAKLAKAIMPMAPAISIRPVVGRKPVRTATAITSRMLSIVCSMPFTTCPARTAARGSTWCGT